MNCDLCGRPIKWSYDTSGGTRCCSSCWEVNEDDRRSDEGVPNQVGPFDYGTGGGIRVIRETKTH